MVSAGEDFDYVIVGGGTAGSVVASRLSQDPGNRVLLVEAGQAEGPAAMSVPGAWLGLRGSEVDWGYRTVAQPALGGREIDYPRGKVLGGSSAVNALMNVRGHRGAVDAWGVAGWSSAELLPYYRRSERTEGLDPRHRGTDGPMRPRVPDTRHPASEAAYEAFVELGIPATDDLNGANAEGVAWTELTAVDGVRQSAADAYLRPAAKRPNLTVVTGALVAALTFSGNRCTGVRYVKDGQEAQARAAREVVLSAGAIGSPHLLQLSGVGPADLLREHGIEVVLDAPGVGAGLSDHTLGAVTYSAAQDMPPGVNNHIEVLAAVRSSESVSRPDLHLLFLDVPMGLPRPASGYAVAFSVLSPHSRGSVSLVSADPRVSPAIDPGFFTDERDVDRMLTGLRLAREVGGSKALRPWREREVLPGPQRGSDEELRAYLRAGVISYFHPVGTCRMGTGPTAVVDEDLRVRGLENLRVVDASVMPTLPDANPNATVLAVAEKAADLITGSPSAP
ncbi:FAD-dependent oxidoreductase [Streptomyces sp. E-15]